MKKLHLEIITPEETLLAEDVDMVVIPTTQGEVGILPSHAALFAKVVPGEAKIRKGNSEHFFAVTSGFLEVLGDNVNLLVNYAIRAEDIELAKVEEAKKRAEKLMEEKTTEREFAIAQAELRKSLLELRVARKRRVRG